MRHEEHHPDAPASLGAVVRRLIAVLGIGALVTGSVLVLELAGLALPAGASTTYTVNSLSDLGDAVPGDGTCEVATGGAECGLRAAIEEANASGGSIGFGLTGAGPHVFTPTAPYPPLGSWTTIDGYTQPGAAPRTTGWWGVNDAVIRIVIDRSHFVDMLLCGGSFVLPGLCVAGDFVTIRGLSIVGNPTPPPGTSASDGAGIRVVGDDATIAGNFIGMWPDGAPSTDEGGLPDQPTAPGVFVYGSSRSMIGGTSPSDANVIGWVRGGVTLSFSGGAAPEVGPSTVIPLTVQGNFIGVGPDGDTPAGDLNGSAVAVIWSNDVVIDHNVLSGGYASGVNTNGSGPRLHVTANRVGTDRTGSLARPNNTGLVVSYPDASIGVDRDGAVAGNVISGNAYYGIQLSGATNSVVAGNHIGVDAAGTSAVPNARDGIYAPSTNRALIGGSIPDAGNVIGGNGQSGLYLGGFDHRIIGNAIGVGADGTSDVGNGNNGIRLWYGGRNTVHDNHIAHNAWDGIRVEYRSGHRLATNSIHDNGLLGIDLRGASGVEANDAGDTDSGGNNLQNYPVLTTAESTTASTRVVGTLDSIADTAFTIEVFANSAPDSSGHGEGETPLGSFSVTTDGTGHAAFDDATLAGSAPGSWITATATLPTVRPEPFVPADPPGDTSEFSTAILSTSGIEPADAIDDVARTDEDVTVVIDVLSNDTGDLDPTALEVRSAPANGTATVRADSQVDYSPAADFFGVDSFTYRVCDVGGSCDTATVTVDVAPVADAPVAVDDATSTEEDTVVHIDVAANDSDADGDLDPGTIEVVGAPSNGTTSLGAPGSGIVNYEPAANFDGFDDFAYRICDLGGRCDTATVWISVTPAEDPPIAVDDSETTPEDQRITIAVSSNDSDPDGNLDHASVTPAPPRHGIALPNFDGTVLYIPDDDFHGIDQFLYSICDTDGLCSAAWVTVTVTPLPDPPVAADDAKSLPEDSVTDIFVFANDTDPDGDLDVTTTRIVTPPTNGRAVYEGAITIAYAPDPDYFGPDSFDYEVCDSTGRCDTATVSVTVTPVNDAPVANWDGYRFDEDTNFSADVGGNDVDIDDFPADLTFSLQSGPSHAAGFVFQADGVFAYHPPADFFGNDEFRYEVCDPDGACSSTNVYLSIDPVNDAPVAVDDPAETDENTSVAIVVLANDSDVDDAGSVLGVSLPFGQPTHGAASVIGQVVVYSPATDYVGVDSFDYSVCDDDGACDRASVTVTVNDAASDRDLDGYIDVADGGDDCNDRDGSIHPGAPETANDGVDQDCDGFDLIGLFIDEGVGVADDNTLLPPVTLDLHEGVGVADDNTVLPPVALDLHEGVGVADDNAVVSDGDFDDDGIDDVVDGFVLFGDWYDFSDSLSTRFSDQNRGGTTYGRIDSDPNDIIRVHDVDAPTGVLIEAVGTATDADAAVLVCGFDSFVLRFSPGDAFELTCGSAIVGVVAGDAVISMDDGTTVTIPDGGEATFTDEADATHITNTGTTDLTVEAHGTQTLVPPGDTLVEPGSDIDGDGLTGIEEYLLGTDPVDPDSDGDGVLDGLDPDFIVVMVDRLARSDFSSAGVRRSIEAVLGDVEDALAADDVATARDLLTNLLRHLSGCGDSPDSNDWITNCDAQIQIRTGVSELLARLDEEELT